MTRLRRVLKSLFLPKGALFNLPLLIALTVVWWCLMGFVIWLHSVWENLFTITLAIYGSIFFGCAFWFWVILIVITVVYRIWAIKNGFRPRL